MKKPKKLAFPNIVSVTKFKLDKRLSLIDGKSGNIPKITFNSALIKFKIPSNIKLLHQIGRAHV